MSIHVGNCSRCGINARLRFRDFSDQAITALVVWGEMEEEVVSQPICDDCHDELREILIERNEEIFSPKKPVQEIRPIVAKKEAPVPQKSVSAAKTKPAAKEAQAKTAKAEKVEKTAKAKPAPQKPAKKTKVAAAKGKKIKRAG